LKADAAQVGLETVLLKVSLGVAQLAYANQCAVFHLVAFVLAPETLVAQLLVGPIPWTVNSGLDATDVARVEGQRGGGEVMRDVAAKAAIGVCAC